MSLLHLKVQEWDDSAGREAFQNAKVRYWLKINNCPCDLPLPDPDMYIDEVDYDAVVNPELVADLNVEPQQPAPVESSFLYMNAPIGWANTAVPLPRSGLAAQHLPANSDVRFMAHPLQPTPWNVPVINSGWGVTGQPFYAWNPASWDRNYAYGSQWNTGRGWGNNSMYRTSGPSRNNNNQAGREHGRRNFRGNQQRKSASNDSGATSQPKKSDS